MIMLWYFTMGIVTKFRSDIINALQVNNSDYRSIIWKRPRLGQEDEWQKLIDRNNIKVLISKLGYTLCVHISTYFQCVFLERVKKNPLM